MTSFFIFQQYEHILPIKILCPVPNDIQLLGLSLIVC